MIRRAGVVTIAVAMAVGMTSAAALAEPQEAPAQTTQLGGLRIPSASQPASDAADHPSPAPLSKLRGTLDRTSESQAVFVRFRGEGAAVGVFESRARAGTLGPSAMKTDTERAERVAATARQRIRGTARQVLRTAERADAAADQLFTTTNAVPGVGLRLDWAGIQAVAARDDVVSVSAIVPKERATAGAAQLNRSLRQWRQTGRTGKGVRIGIVDSGIDYTHAAFGGPGTPEAFAQASAGSAGEWTPTPVVVGGYDLVGDDYDADSNPVPEPDPNPLDCDGHGTHVAGIAAGRGVNADGSTFTGDYRKLTSERLYDMRIGPGTAPEASVYALRIFGCAGSTEMIIPALDRVLDPDGDGDYSDHLDIVNLSVGTDYGAADDPDAEFVNVLAAAGVLPVVAAGNGGDLTGIGGSPGGATRALTVASSVDEFQLRDGIDVVAPAQLAGQFGGQAGKEYVWEDSHEVVGDVVPVGSATNLDGCDEFSAADAAAIRGNIVWLEWDDTDTTRRCGSVTRSLNVAAAGGTGILLPTTLDIFPAGIAGSADIPSFQLTHRASERLRPAMAAGTLRVRLSGSLAGTIQDVDPALAGRLSAFSSRGPHSGPGGAKPDVAAPGDTIVSAQSGGGFTGDVRSGTSMAVPMVSGTAALVLESHPDWSPEQVKAAVMNSADRALTTRGAGSGTAYGPLRVGAGQADAAAAVAATTLAYAAQDPGAVSLSFGVRSVPVGEGAQKVARTVVVHNTGSSRRSYRATYQAVTNQPGVSYRVSPSRVSLDPGAKAELRVTMRIDPTQLRREREASMAAAQGLRLPDGSFTEAPRQYVPAASGRVQLTSPAGERVRVPVVGSARPVSTTTTGVSAGSGGEGVVLSTSGQGVNGRGPQDVRYVSRQSVLTLGATSPRQEPCTARVLVNCRPFRSAAAADLKYVAAGSSPATATDPAKLWFAVSTWGQWTAINPTQSAPLVLIDVDRDGSADFEVDGYPSPGTDLFYAHLTDLNTGQLVDVQPLNFLPADRDTNVFDSDVVLLPVDPAKLGMQPGASSFPITYGVGTFSTYADTSGFIPDYVGPIDYDVANPPLHTPQPLYADVAGQQIPVTLNPDADQVQALVVHLYGQPGRRTEVIPVP